MYGEVSVTFGVSIALLQQLERILNKAFSIDLRTDSKSLFNIILKGHRTSEKRIILDIAAELDAFRDNIISDKGLFWNHHNISDASTKPMSESLICNTFSKVDLDMQLSNGFCALQRSVWVIRTTIQL